MCPIEGRNEGIWSPVAFFGGLSGIHRGFGWCLAHVVLFGGTLGFRGVRRTFEGVAIAADWRWFRCFAAVLPLAAFLLPPFSQCFLLVSFSGCLSLGVF